MAAERVVLQLRWDHQFQFAGYYAALWQGYYKDAGLDVEIRSAFETGARVNALEEVSAGRAHFGIGAADVLLARENGADLSVIASYFQHSPVEVFVKRNAGIRGPSDLVDKKLASGVDPLIDVEVDAMLRIEGVAPSSIKRVELSADRSAHDYLNELENGSIDALPVYALSSLWAARQSGLDFMRLHPSAYGADFYGDSLVVETTWAKDNLQAVDAFVKATNQGWEYALQNKSELIEHISTKLKRHLPLEDAETYNRFLAKEISAIMLFPTIQAGNVNPQRWERIGHTLWQNGLLKEAPKHTEFVISAHEALEEQFHRSASVVVGLLLTIMVFGVGYIYWWRHVRIKDVQFRELFENMHNGVAVYRAVDGGKDFVFTNFNKGGERIENVSRDQLIGKRVTEVFPGVEDFGLLDVFERVWRTGKPEHFPLGFYDDERISGWRENYIYKLPNGELVAVYEDATARKQAEQELELMNKELEQRIETRTADLKDEIARHKDTLEQLRLFSRAVEQSPNMIFITNLNGIIQYTNPKFTELTGYGAAEALGQKPSLIKSGDTPIDVYQELWQTIMSGREWRGEIKDRRKNGKIFWAAISISPVRDNDDEITHFVAMHEDITHRRVAEEKIRTAMEHAHVANRAKSELLANMSHELRTPLNAIIGFSNTIRDEVFGPIENEKYPEYAGDILRSGEHLLDLINDILDVSAIEAGKLSLHEEVISVQDAIDSSVRLVRPRADKERVKLVRDETLDLPMLKADMRRLKQILINLLSNAVKFTPDGGEVIISAGLSENDEVQILVKDTGVGMTPEELMKAKSQFGQADSGLDRKHEGTGLGLPLTMNLVELHGGQFDIVSAKGEGTSITMTFPAERTSRV
ncbi:ABC transporter substrate-binding protein [Magnetovibrio sp. PR-2]|uniref:ABC transporter substrate-binding protein n=1 Tax=Magnetovibrio sp. PR-2 TaxID=3120356 RepID=UPI002FCE53B7